MLPQWEMAKYTVYFSGHYTKILSILVLNTQVFQRAVYKRDKRSNHFASFLEIANSSPLSF